MEKLPKLSVIDPISPAIERVRDVLFRPFDLGRWFVIGFCAFLAYLGEGGGGGSGFSRSSYDTGSFDEVKEFFSENLYWIAPVVVAGVVLLVGLGILLLWLRSRGKFMFLHCVAKNKAEVKVPWSRYKGEGNSLFLFSFVVGIISFVCFAILTGLIILCIIVLKRKGIGIALWIGGISFTVLVAMVIGIGFALLSKFTKDFVVPIMYLRSCKTVEGWRQFLPILSARKGAFALYILFQIVINLAIGTISVTATLIACCFCCLGVLFFIPYIGTVLLLPLHVFKRSYSLYYIRQFGPQFDVFSA